MHPHGTLVFAAPAEQVAQGKVKLRGVRIVLDGFNKGINGLVLLLVKQKIQALEVGFGGTPVLQSHLPQIKTGREPAQHKRHWQAQQNPAKVKVHAMAG